MNPKFHDLVVTHWGARFMGYNLPVAIGRSGIAEKTGEGDGITPIGNFLIKGIGFRNDRVSFYAPNIEKKTTKINDYGQMILWIKIIIIRFILTIILLAMKSFADQITYIMRTEF